MSSISDFGAKIGAARKDIRGDFTTEDIASMTHIERTKRVRKDKVWPVPDYAELIATGHTRQAALTIKILRDSLPPTVPYVGKFDEAAYLTACLRYAEILNTLRVLQPCKSLAEMRTLLAEDSPLTRLTGRYTPDPTGPNAMPAYCYAAKCVLQAVSRDRLTYDAATILRQNPDWPAGTSAADVFLRKHHLSVKENGGRYYAAYHDHSANTESGAYYLANVAETLPALKPIISQSFDSAEAATEALRRCAEENIAAKRTKRQTQREKILNITATTTRRIPDKQQGLCYRSRHATGEDFMTELGLRGGEFGNWVNQTERQLLLDMGYDAFRDLADAYGWAPSGVSLNGTLAIAFGARGGVWDRSGNDVKDAHYEPGRAVINLTKPHGAGALAHEFGHALDHALGKRAVALGIAAPFKDGRDYLSHLKLSDAGPGETPEAGELRALRASFDLLRSRPLDLPERIARSERDLKNYSTGLSRLLAAGRTDVTYSAKFRAASEAEKTELLAQYDKLAGKIAAAPSQEACEPLIAFITPLLRKDPRETLTRELNWRSTTCQQVAQRLAAPEKCPMSDSTDYYRTALHMDHLRGGGKPLYYSTAPEMFARAFAYMTFERLYREGRYNPFLMDPRQEGPFPEEKEAAMFESAIAPLLGRLFPKVGLEVPIEETPTPSMQRLTA